VDETSNVVPMNEDSAEMAEFYDFVTKMNQADLEKALVMNRKERRRFLRSQKKRKGYTR
jgi:hypothetical protein